MVVDASRRGLVLSVRCSALHISSINLMFILDLSSPYLNITQLNFLCISNLIKLCMLQFIHSSAQMQLQQGCTLNMSIQTTAGSTPGPCCPAHWPSSQPGCRCPWPGPAGRRPCPACRCFVNITKRHKHPVRRKDIYLHHSSSTQQTNTLHHFPCMHKPERCLPRCAPCPGQSLRGPRPCPWPAPGHESTSQQVHHTCNNKSHC